MNKAKSRAAGLIIVTVACCVVSAIAELLIEPPYLIKSAMKIAVFLGVPLIYSKIAGIRLFENFRNVEKKDIAKLLALGAAVYAVIFGVYLATRNVFDYAALVRSQAEDQKVGGGSFIPVALYISFGNSFLEEFLFRLAAFLKLSEHLNRKAAYIFSSVMFAAYHVAIIGATFPPALLAATLAALAVGGFIFDLVDAKRGNIYNSWIVHMFADFAIMTVWYINM